MVENAVVIPECLVNAIQDEIIAKTVPTWLHHTVDRIWIFSTGFPFENGIIYSAQYQSLPDYIICDSVHDHYQSLLDYIICDTPSFIPFSCTGRNKLKEIISKLQFQPKRMQMFQRQKKCIMHIWWRIVRNMSNRHQVIIKIRGKRMCKEFYTVKYWRMRKNGFF